MVTGGNYPATYGANNEWPSRSHSNEPQYPGAPQAARPAVVSPPTSVYTNGSMMDGGLMHGGTPRGSNGNLSPPSSIGRSSDGMGLYSHSQSGSIDGRRTQLAEESLFEHYKVLKSYLSTPSDGDRGPAKPNRARDKLLRLSSIQFQELSTDVYDELLRREDERHRGGPGAPGNNTPRYLPPKRNFHPKRNQARQKLSTLPIDRFRQLASDVFFELERRVPRFGAPDTDRGGSPALSTSSSHRSGPSMSHRGPAGRGQPPPFRDGPNNAPNGGALGVPGLGSGPGPMNELGRPLPKMPQSNTIIPNKSTMVEDDDDNSAEEEEDDDDADAFSLERAALRQSKRKSKKANTENERAKESPPEYQAQTKQLQEQLGALEGKLRARDEEIERLIQFGNEKQKAAEAEQSQWSMLRSNLERQLDDAQRMNDSLQNEINRIRAENERTERDLLSQLEDQKDNGSANEDLQRRYDGLQQELRDQQQITDSVRHQASEFLAEMRELSARSTVALEKEEKLNRQINTLEKDVTEWKNRYIRTKSQLRSSRASSMGLSAANTANTVSLRDRKFMDPDGLIQDTHFTKFQISIDELLQKARSSDSTAVLTGIKEVILNVRQITTEVDQGSTQVNREDLSTDAGKAHAKIKARVSGTANNLITAGKNHAAASGLLPVSLLDAAASHLANAIVDLARTVKIRPTQAGEVEDGRSSSHIDDQRVSYSGFTNGHHYGDSISSYPISIPSMSGAPPDTHIGGTRYRDTAALIEDLRGNVEEQSAALVHSIQPLVHTIRSTPASAPLAPADEAAIADFVRNVSITVEDVCGTVRSVIEECADGALAKHAGSLTAVLEDCRMGLVDASGDFSSGGREKIPPIAFKIARITKELVNRIERIKMGELTVDHSLPADF